MKRSTRLALALLAISPGGALPSEFPITFELDAGQHLSLGVFEPSTGRLVRTLRNREFFGEGTHTVAWDGVDDRGTPLPEGKYEWRAVSTPGFTARYVTAIGINPPGGEHPVANQSWVGDHNGAGIVDVDPSGVYVGSPMTEGGRMVLKADPEMTRILWRRPQFYQSGRLSRVCSSGTHVFMIHPNGKLRRLNRENGNVEAEWNARFDDEAPGDIDAMGALAVLTYPKAGKVRWLSGRDASAVGTINMAGAGAVTMHLSNGALVATGREIFEVVQGGSPKKVAALDGPIVAMDYDPGGKELWVAVAGHRVVRMNGDFRVTATFGSAPREQGSYDPNRFAGIYDIAADLEGGFFIAEPGPAPRRLAHFSENGGLLGEWYGAMSFYVSAAFDPDDPRRIYGVAPEGWVNVYHIDYEEGTWTIEATYRTGRLGDSLFPNAGNFTAVRRNGTLFLYHRAVPAVIRLDRKQRKAVPVAIAGTVRNRGRSFYQFAGTGRDGYPKPWVAAAEHHGFPDPAKAPKHFTWADADGDGVFDPAEFRFHPDARGGISFHNPGAFASNGDYLGASGINATHAFFRLPVKAWEGPQRNAPRWDWDGMAAAGEIIADRLGWGSARGLSVAHDGSVAVAFQAGLLIRGHGQYEGGGWPEQSVRGCRLLGYDSEMKPLFAAGRQSKLGGEAATGVLYYPMTTAFGPNGSIIVNDQTKQPAQVWTRDGLYAGSFFDRRADDGLPDGFYAVHGDDNQGATIATAADGTTYWLMPYIGFNRLYEIRGWNGWKRLSGSISLGRPPPPVEDKGTGLAAHPPNGEGTVVLSGYIMPPLTDRYQFMGLPEKGDRIAITIDGTPVYAHPPDDTTIGHAEMRRGHRHRIRIVSVRKNRDKELKLFWSSRVMDPVLLSDDVLFPDREEGRGEKE